MSAQRFVVLENGVKEEIPAVVVTTGDSPQLFVLLSIGIWGRTHTIIGDSGRSNI